MKKIYLLACAAMFSSAISAQHTMKIANPLKTKSVRTEKGTTPNANRAVATTIVCNTQYVAGTTMDLSFTYTTTNTDFEYGDFLEITFPAGVTPNVSATNTDPFPNTEDAAGGLEPLIAPVGQVISWGDPAGADAYGGIFSTTGIGFTVNVTIGAGVTGNPVANYFVSGDGYGAAPADYNGTFTMYPAGASLVDLQTIFIQPYNITSLSVCNYGLDTLVAKIMNIGNTTESNIEVFYSVNGVAQPSVIEPGPLAPGDSAFIFWVPGYDFTGSATNDIKGWLAVAGDISAANDTASLTFTNNVSIALSTTPYDNGIEGTEVNSLTIDGTAAPFTGLSQGTFHAGLQALFTTVATTNPAGSYDLMISMPCMDVTLGETYRISCWRRTNTASAGNGQSGFFTGLAPDAASMTTTLKAYSAITPLATWLQDSVDYIATATETRYFGIGATGTVTATSQMNVRFDDINIHLVPSAVGITKTTKESLSVYPSPSTGIFNINVSDANTQLEVYNLLGAKIYNTQLSKGINAINLSDVAEGTYFVKVINDNKVSTQKVVINK